MIPHNQADEHRARGIRSTNYDLVSDSPSPFRTLCVYALACSAVLADNALVCVFALFLLRRVGVSYFGRPAVLLRVHTIW